MVFKIKRDANGKLERHKARLVAQGFSQLFKKDDDKTSSPGVRFKSLRTVIAFEMDATTAF